MSRPSVTYYAFAILLGVSAMAWLIFLIGWKAALAIFLLLWANNIERRIAP